MSNASHRKRSLSPRSHPSSACLHALAPSRFDYHPDIQNVTYTTLVDHPTTAMFPDPYISYEEAYHHRTDPRDVGATALLTYDQDALTDPKFGTTGYYQGSPPAAAWFRDGAVTPVDLNNETTAAESSSVFRGRTWYTSLGCVVPSVVAPQILVLTASPDRFVAP